MTEQLTQEQLAEMSKEYDAMPLDEQAAIAVGSSIMGAIDKGLSQDQIADILSSGLDLYRQIVIGSTMRALTTPDDSKPFGLLIRKGNTDDSLKLQRACAFATMVNDEERKKVVERFYNLVEVLLDIKAPPREANDKEVAA